ncbi:hypothetical protein LINGRAHAP2_LOCUS14926 [Linum grandiflorum]
MATQPLTNLNEMITAKPPTIPSSSYRNELTTGDVPSMVNPGFDSNTASLQLSASPIAAGTSSNLNEKTAEKPPIIPSLSYRNELTTGLDPGLGIGSLIAKPRVLPLPLLPVGPVSFPIRVPQQTPITPSQITHPAVPSDYQNGGTAGNLMRNGTTFINIMVSFGNKHQDF